MKLLTVVLVLALGISQIGASSSTAEPTVATTTAGDATTVTTNAPAGTTIGATGTTGAPASTVTGGTPGSTQQPVSTVPASTVTPTPLALSTFPVSNDVAPLDAKLILQQAVQLEQQIKDLNNYLIQAQDDTNPANSPLFTQLQNMSTVINSQNATLQGYLVTLQTLSATQSNLDSRLNSATGTFTCFSQSSCVTDVPTTPEPTSPGPTPAVTSCTNNKTLTTSYTSQKYNFDPVTNQALCYVELQTSTPNNNINIVINVTITGNDAYVQLREPRTDMVVIMNQTTTQYNFTSFQSAEVSYYSGPRSSVAFSFDYVEVNSCTLNCNSPNGTCKTSQSGVQYCECKKCEFTGDNCETPMPDPCQAKQKRLCNANASPPTGVCYRNSCFDQCYACSCSPGAEGDTPQSCSKIAPTGAPAPAAPTAAPVCATTGAPSTTTAFLTSTVAPTGAASSTVTSSGGSTAGGSTVGGSTVTGPTASAASSTVAPTSTAAPETSSTTANPSTTSLIKDGGDS